MLYDYAIKHNHMITNKAEQRHKILLFWRQYGLKAANDAYGASRSPHFMAGGSCIAIQAMSWPSLTQALKPQSGAGKG